MTVAVRTRLPRGIRNNNPGNIKRNNIQWQGMSAFQTDDTFVQFERPEYGFRAMARIFQSYQNRGLLTIREMISTYAPSTENKTDAYIAFISDRLNLSPDEPVNLDVYMPQLIQAVSVFENGTQFAELFILKDIQTGIALA